MTGETAEAKKGTWKGRGRCIPGQRHREEAKPGGNPHLFRGKGAGVCTSSPLVSQPMAGKDRTIRVREEETGSRKSA